MMNHTDKSIRNDKADIIKPFFYKEDNKGFKEKGVLFCFFEGCIFSVLIKRWRRNTTDI